MLFETDLHWFEKTGVVVGKLLDDLAASNAVRAQTVQNGLIESPHGSERRIDV